MLWRFSRIISLEVMPGLGVKLLSISCHEIRGRSLGVLDDGTVCRVAVVLSIQDGAQM